MNRVPRQGLLPVDADAEEVCGFFGLEDEACGRLRLYVEELRHWNARMNLVAPSTLEQVWQRHVADGVQLLEHLPEEARQVIDLGSGSGVPGLVMALAAPERARYVLVESSSRKCAFLRQVAQRAGVAVAVLPRRIETLDAAGLGVGPETVIVARALAPLARMLDLAAPLFEAGAQAVLLKGRQAAAEVDAARRHWDFRADMVNSVTDAEGVIVKLREVRRV